MRPAWPAPIAPNPLPEAIPESRRPKIPCPPVDQVKAVDGISFSVQRGQTVGLVGESGSGKTTTGRAIARLAPVTSGSIRYAGEELTKLRSSAFFPCRKKIQVIFQDPFGSLNPRMSVYAILAEPLEIHFRDWSKSQREDRVAELLNKVGLDPDHMRRFPHQFPKFRHLSSGGCPRIR